MSRYNLSVAVNPKTGEYEDVAMLNDYYGYYEYAVLFKDGGIYPLKEVKFAKPCKWEEFDVKSALKKKPHKNY